MSTLSDERGGGGGGGEVLAPVDRRSATAGPRQRRRDMACRLQTLSRSVGRRQLQQLHGATASI